IGRGEVRPEADGDEIATVLIAALEGGVMLSTLYGDPEHAQRTSDYLSWYLQANVSS
ncbi:MAG: TetR/AcrR family transcriptional regulator, partial [Gemmatimonadetes bacterium]|nr:TetR/AcrR family transcriptional regulator [Gemmatimonadota bacterium]